MVMQRVPVKITSEMREELHKLNLHGDFMVSELARRALDIKEKCLAVGLMEIERQRLLGKYHGFNDLSREIIARRTALAEIIKKETQDNG